MPEVIDMLPELGFEIFPIEVKLIVRLTEVGELEKTVIPLLF